MRKCIFLFAFTFHFIFSSTGQSLPFPDFDGILEYENQQITFIFQVKQEGTNVDIELYIPEQLIFGKKANRTTFSEDSVTIVFRDFQAEYSGRIVSDSMYINGQWTQRGKPFPLLLHFREKLNAVSFDRPQEPFPPFPYFEKELMIPNKKDKIFLSGTLTLPDTNKNHPLVILITGSGPQNRDEEIAGHKPFLVIADDLTRNGIAVFRFDDRGVGRSTGNFGSATTSDFASDVLSIVSFFRKYPNINPKKIGLIGHSEGGMVAMVAAAKNKKDIAFIISLAGPGVNIIDLLLKQTEDIMRASGANEELIEMTRSVNFQLYNLALTEPNIDSLMKKMTGFLSEVTSELSEKEIEEMGFSHEQIRMAAMQLFTPWMKFFLAFKPSDYLKKVKCPVLALNGSLDLQVSADENLEAISRFLTEGKNRQVTVKTLNGLNHLFQKAETGKISEYMLISETIHESVLKILKDYIKAVVQE
jgi:uncharacterized protein